MSNVECRMSNVSRKAQRTKLSFDLRHSLFDIRHWVAGLPRSGARSVARVADPNSATFFAGINVMYLTESLARLRESLPADISNFMPEVILCGGIVLVLLLRLFTRFQRAHVGALALIVAVACLVCSWVQGSEYPVPAEIFGGMLAFDRFTVFLRLFLYGFASLLVWLSL